MLGGHVLAKCVLVCSCKQEGRGRLQEAGEAPVGGRAMAAQPAPVSVRVLLVLRASLSRPAQCNAVLSIERFENLFTVVHVT